MSLPQDRAEPEPRGRGAPLHERPETARPPVHASEAPLSDEALEPLDVDIDALLPVAMGTGAERVVIGPDLAELLRAAEERLDARGPISQRTDAGDDVADVPVPDDVLRLLAEPLEADDDDGHTGGPGASSAGTGAERPGTMDGQVGTAHGQEEDLEELLPRASDPPKELTRARPMTSVGREEPAPAPEPRQGAITRTGFADEPSFRGEPSAGQARASEEGYREPAYREPAYREPAYREPAYREPDPYRERADLATPAVPMSAISRVLGDRGPGIDRGAALIERAAMAPRADVPSRKPASERPAPGAFERAASASDRGAGVASGAQTGDRPSARTGERGPHADPTRWHTAKMVSPAAAEPIESGPKSRAAMARTEAMPAVLGPGDAARALGRAIASRVSGALVIASGDEQRRVVLHDGDMVTAGSSAPLESLVAFLSARGDIDRDLVPRLAGKLPPFGRHAGAALVAHGHLGQDDLWPALRAHAEWVIGRALLVDSGTCELELDPPARYKAEPSVFGGATGAEVLVEVVQRAIAPEAALARLGGYGARLAPGARPALLAECALSGDEEDAIRAAPGHTIHEFAGDGPTERWSMLYALVCLDVLEALPPVAAPQKRAEREADPLDEEAVRARVRARLALVEEGDYFALLGVPRAATSYEVRRAYLDLRRTFEPARILTAGTADLADDVRLVVEVVEEAYEVLRDTNRRERYRRAIEGAPPPR